MASAVPQAPPPIMPTVCKAIAARYPCLAPVIQESPAMLEAGLILGLYARGKRGRRSGGELPARFGGCVHPIRESERETLGSRPGHHRGIVGAELYGR